MDLEEALIECVSNKNGYCKDTLSKCCLAASSPRASEETRLCPVHSTVLDQKNLALTVFRAKPVFCALIYKTIFDLEFPKNFNKLRTLIRVNSINAIFF